MSMAMVIGPTPPGTGESQLATSATPGSTSPASRQPRSRVVSSTRLIPTSTTTAPGLIHEGFTMSGRPTAATKISASLHTASSSWVLECATVTVASAPRAARRRAAGIPTIRDRPTTTARFPSRSMFAQRSIRRTPLGVQGSIPSVLPWTRRPRFCG